MTSTGSEHLAPGAGGPAAPLQLTALPGSEREPVGARFTDAVRPEVPHPGGKDPSNEEVQATVVLRRRTDAPAPPLSGPGLKRSEFAATYGADPGDVDIVVSRLTELGLSVLSVDAGSRRVRVAGSVSDVERVFGTTLTAAAEVGSGGTTYRVRSGALFVPHELDGIVTAVLGLDDRPQSRALYRTAAPHALATSYTPVQLAAVYDFPAGADGTGQTVAIIELGGGYESADLSTYFTGLGLTPPRVSAVGVDGASNQPGGDPTGADGEVMLDIEVVGALAPGADIVVYFAPNTDAGFLDAVSQAAHASPTPTAMSISWGQSEEAWTGQARAALDGAFVDAAALGVTVTVAAGDDGSQDRVQDGSVHVDFPAASPHALACGGTRLTVDPGTGRVTSETVWNNGLGAGATGGGFSTTFGRPAYQAHALPAGPPASGPLGANGRGVPDVAAVADPQTGYQVLVDGQRQVIGGTSAVAPLWAALVARLAQLRGQRFGLIQPLLYAAAPAGAAADGFRDVTEGSNGAYSATAGWDACTGLGVPIGSRLAALPHA